MAGPRTVPVEVGSRYTDEDWSQKLMTVSEFIDNYVINEVSHHSATQVIQKKWNLSAKTVLSSFRRHWPLLKGILLSINSLTR